MKSTGNTILITGGGSGIGRGLAESFHQLGNQVIIAGRRKEVLDQVTAANPGMKSGILDVSSPDSIHAFAQQMNQDFPKLNVLINNSGIMKPETITDPFALSIAEDTITTNLLGPIRLTTALLPLLQKQVDSVIMAVTSGLAFVPLAMAPTYCATKAAIHSYLLSLRYQLRTTNIQVIEIAPPYVATELGGDQQKNDPRAMPLNDYIAEVMQILRTQPKVTEVLVERVKFLRDAEASGKYDQVFKNLNDHFA